MDFVMDFVNGSNENQHIIVLTPENAPKNLDYDNDHPDIRSLHTPDIKS